MQNISSSPREHTSSPSLLPLWPVSPSVLGPAVLGAVQPRCSPRCSPRDDVLSSVPAKLRGSTRPRWNSFISWFNYHN
ncbi:hypothetical protein VZT92_026402 [Zoarces viviparus]|uniref:Uncharacterized protein n=1 Tax=Zoarces viviparus TaxID=48416 RepID=A0AAW1DZT9_ZOAVI